MSTAETVERLEKEQTAFNEKLDAMLKNHAGEFVVFKDQNPVEFTTTFAEAYRTGIERFGLDEIFLVSRVARDDPQPASLSWEAGVLG